MVKSKLEFVGFPYIPHCPVCGSRLRTSTGSGVHGSAKFYCPKCDIGLGSTEVKYRKNVRSTYFRQGV